MKYVLLIVAVVLTCFNIIPFFERLTIRMNQEDYREERLIVGGIAFRENAIQGKLKSSGDPEFMAAPGSQRWRILWDEDDLLRVYPIGSEIDVLYNPNTVVNAHTVGIFPGDLDYFDEEGPRLFRRSALLTFLPLSLALINFFVWYPNKRHKRLE